MTPTDKVLKMDLANLSEEDLLWLHDFKNKATVMQGRLQLKHAKETEIEQMYLISSSLGMSIVVSNKQDPTWFVNAVTERGGVVRVERMAE